MDAQRDSPPTGNFLSRMKRENPVKEGGATRTMPGAKIEETSHVFVEERDLFWKGAIERSPS